MLRQQDTNIAIPDLSRQTVAARLHEVSLQLRSSNALFDNYDFDMREISALLEAACNIIASPIEKAPLSLLSEQNYSQRNQQLPLISALLQAMTDSSPVGYYVVDHPTDQILFANSRFYEIWGVDKYRTAIESGQITHHILLPNLLSQLKDPQEALHCCQQLSESEQHISRQNEIRLADNRLIRQFTTQIFDRQHKYLGQVYDFFDITEKKTPRSGNTRTTTCAYHASE